MNKSRGCCWKHTRAAERHVVPTLNSVLVLVGGSEKAAGREELLPGPQTHPWCSRCWHWRFNSSLWLQFQQERLACKSTCVCACVCHTHTHTNLRCSLEKHMHSSVAVDFSVDVFKCLVRCVSVGGFWEGGCVLVTVHCRVTPRRFISPLSHVDVGIEDSACKSEFL